MDKLNLKATIPTLLLSRSLWVVIFNLIFVVTIHFIPELEANLPQIIGSSFVLAGMIAGKFGVTDILLAAKYGHENAKYNKID